jgi:hypothetical protein
MPRAQPSGIWNSGARAEDLVRELTGADKVEKGDARGDGRLLGHWFEVKHVGGAGGAMSQVRAYKFIPLVAYFEPRRTWYVAPPNRVVYLVSRRGGQHGQNPFVCAQLTIKDLRGCRVEVEALRQAILDAVETGTAHPALREAMREVARAEDELAAESVRRVREVLRHPPPGQPLMEPEQLTLI